MSGRPPLDELTVTFTRAAILAYGGPGRHLHADLDVARSLGFPDLVSWGTMTILPFSELLSRIAGPAWEGGSSLTVRLSRPVCAGDSVTYSATEIAGTGGDCPGGRMLSLIAVSSRLGVVAQAQAVLRPLPTFSSTGDL